jgi:HD superfamily phosphodiesterase
MKEEFEKIFELARPFLDTRGNELHTRIALAFAEELLAAEGGNPHVVIPAVILHDVGWKCVPEEVQLNAFGPGKKDRSLNRVHEIEGARIARRILDEVHYDSALIAEILDIVEGHDSRAEALSLNDALVKDADKLWRYSQHGFAVDTERFEVDQDKYLDGLRKRIDTWLFTDAAKLIAAKEYELRNKERQN